MMQNLISQPGSRKTWLHVHNRIRSVIEARWLLQDPWNNFPLLHYAMKSITNLLLIG